MSGTPETTIRLKMARPALVPLTIVTRGSPRVVKVVLQAVNDAQSPFYLLQPDPDGTLRLSVRSGFYSLRVQRQNGHWNEAPAIVKLVARIDPTQPPDIRHPQPLRLNIGADDSGDVPEEPAAAAKRRRNMV